jgi:hypothetical protein
LLNEFADLLVRGRLSMRTLRGQIRSGLREPEEPRTTSRQRAVQAD